MMAELSDRVLALNLRFGGRAAGHSLRDIHEPRETLRTRPQPNTQKNVR
jgi:hypothetical protein